MRNHLTYANVTSTLALVIAVAGGTAYAADTIGSIDVIDNSLRSVDLKNNDVRSVDVRSEELTGVDIADQSGVDTCTHGTSRYGELCVANPDTTERIWYQAAVHCSNLQLRLPSTGEAMSLAKHYDVPTVGNFPEGQFFWTDEQTDSASSGGAVVDEAGNLANTPASNSGGSRTVCVTTPTN